MIRVQKKAEGINRTTQHFGIGSPFVYLNTTHNYYLVSYYANEEPRTRRALLGKTARQVRESVYSYIHTYMQVRVLAGTSTTSTRQNQRGKKKHQLNIQEENNNPIGRISKLVFYTTKERRAKTPSDIYVNGLTPTRSVPGHHVRCTRLPLASEKAGSEVHRGVS